MAYGVKQHQQPMEIIMATIKLTATQEKILESAASRENRAIHPLPKNLKGGAAKKVINSLVNKGLVQFDEDEVLNITEYGYHVIGKEPPKQELNTEFKPTRKLRQGTKQAKIIQLLQQPEGATIEQIKEICGWQPHSIRGFLAGTIKKKLGFSLTTNRNRVVRPNQVGSPGSSTIYKITACCVNSC
jgi:hypothetical protein